MYLYVLELLASNWRSSVKTSWVSTKYRFII